MQHILRGALVSTLHCIPVTASEAVIPIRSASTSVPVWSNTTAVRSALPGRKPGLQKNLDF